MKRAILVVVAISVIFSGAAAGQTGARSFLQQLFEELVPGSSFTAVVELNHPDGIYRIGEPLQVMITSSQDAYITLIDVAADGRATVLLPNRYTPTPLLRANERLHFPGPTDGFTYAASGPPGLELLKVLATEEPLRVSGAVLGSGMDPFGQLQGAPADIASGINSELKQRHTGTWTSASATLRIIGAPTAAHEPMLSLHVAKYSYRPGEIISLEVTALRECNLMLVTVDSRGEPTILFPNRFQQETIVKAGTSIVIPSPETLGHYVVGPASGVETVFAFCRPSPTAFFAGPFDFGRYEFQPWSSANGFVRDMAPHFASPALQGAVASTSLLVAP